MEDNGYCYRFLKNACNANKHRVLEENIKDNASAKSGQPWGLVNPVNETNDILTNLKNTETY